MLKKLAKITLLPTTPASIGRFDTFADRYPRGTSLRGVVRWWTRAAIAGWAYDQGKEINEAINRVSEIFGGVATGGGEPKPSRIKYQIKLIETSKPQGISHFRLRLIFMRAHSAQRRVPEGKFYRNVKKFYEYLDQLCSESYLLKEKIGNMPEYQAVRNYIENRRGHPSTVRDAVIRLTNTLYDTMISQYKMELTIYTAAIKMDYRDKIGVLGTLLAIELGGIGKISRRGLGCFDIDYWESQYIDKNLEDLKSLRDMMFKDRILYIIKNIRGLLGQESNQKIRRKLPAIPSISLSKIDDLPIFSVWIKEQDNDINNVFRDIESIFLRTRRNSLASFLRYMNPPSAWYLGLPREQRGKGYVGQIRRASPLWVKVSRQNNRNYIIISHMVSLDWPSAIRWIGATKRVIRINEELLIRVAKKVNDWLSEGEYRSIL